MLNFQVPVLNHPWPAITRGNIHRSIESLERCKSRILSVAGKSVSRKPGIQGSVHHRSEVIWTLERRIGGRAGRQVHPKVVVNELSIVNAVSAAEHGVADKIRRPGEADARTKILVVRLCASGVLAEDQSTRRSRRERIHRGGRENGLGASSFVARCVEIPPQTEIQGEISPKLKVILNKGAEVVLRPARMMGGNGKVFRIQLAEKEAGKRIACVGSGVHSLRWSKRCLIVGKGIVGRGIQITDRVLIGAPIDTKR